MEQTFSSHDMPRTPLPGLPFLYEGDSYVIYLVEVGTKMVRIISIHRYRNNQNTTAEEVDIFEDFDLNGRGAVVRQIQRKYKGKGVMLR